MIFNADVTFCSVLEDGQLHVDIALHVEGEGGGGVAAFSGPSRRTQAVVAVLIVISQNRNASRLMLTVMLLTANQPDVTVPSTPGFLTSFWRGAVTLVRVGSIFTHCSILARVAVTLVDVHLTVYTLSGKHRQSDLQHALISYMLIFLLVFTDSTKSQIYSYHLTKKGHSGNLVACVRVCVCVLKSKKN